MPNSHHSDFELSDEEEAEAKVPLKRGLDVRDLLKSEPVMFEVDKEAIERESIETGPNTYRYDESTMGVLNSDCFGDEDAEDDDDSGDSPFTKLSRKMVNVTEDGGVMKRIITPGDGVALPVGATVTAHFDAYIEYQDEPFDSSRLRNKALKIRVGNGETVLGLDVALQSMTKNEISEFLVKPEYAFGEIGCEPRIPGKATIRYRVELVDFLDYLPASDFDRLPPEQKEAATFEARVAAAKAEILCGKKLCDKAPQDYKRAIFHYKKGIEILTSCRLKDQDEEDQWKKYLIRLNQNTSVCYLKLKNYPPTITYANKVLELDANNAKAYYLKGKAKSLLNDYDDARVFLTKSLKLLPNDSDVKRALNDLEVRHHRAKASEKLFCQRMFEQAPVKQVMVTPQFEATANSFLKRFVDESECKQISFPHQVQPDEIKWLTHRVSNMNIIVDVSGEQGHHKITFQK